MAFRTNKTPVLQEKTASGSVASFNTALAMPLASCNIAVTATQSGSGTPSPDNVRSINGHSVIGVSATGKNFFNKNAVTLGKWLTNTGDEHNSQNGAYSDYIPIVTNIPYYFSHVIGISSFYSIAVYDENKTFIETHNIQGSNDASGTITFTQGSYIRVNVYKANLDIVQVELGDTATTYEAYNGTYTTIQIGSTVYGGEYDARTGVLTVTHKAVDLGALTWTKESNHFYSNILSDAKYPPNNSNVAEIMCESYKVISEANVVSEAFDYSIGMSRTGRIYIYDSSLSSGDATAFTTAVTGVKLVYALAIPTTIQLPPCPIDVLEGVNNVFADTGDVDLTYNDLDIAKRGSFREVFKLP